MLICREAGALPRLVHMLSSGDESSLTAAAVWALLQLAGDSPENKKVRAHHQAMFLCLGTVHN